MEASLLPKDLHVNFWLIDPLERKLMKNNAKKLLCIFTPLFGCILAAQAQSIGNENKNLQVDPASKAEVNKVANCARNVCAAGMKIDSTGNPYFDYNGMRYTIGAGPESLAVWIRPIRTTGRKDLKDYLDIGLDGKIDEAQEGLVQNYFKGWGPKLFGVEFRGYYQRGYNQALSTILEYIDSHPKR
jgi:hypothetical protein